VDLLWEIRKTQSPKTKSPWEIGESGSAWPWPGIEPAVPPASLRVARSRITSTRSATNAPSYMSQSGNNAAHR